MNPTPSRTLRSRLDPLTGSPARTAEVLVELATWVEERGRSSKVRFGGAVLCRAFAGLLLRQADEVRTEARRERDAWIGQQA